MEQLCRVVQITNPKGDAMFSFSIGQSVLSGMLMAKSTTQSLIATEAKLGELNSLCVKPRCRYLREAFTAVRKENPDGQEFLGGASGSAPSG
jgi:hypothetical protein